MKIGITTFHKADNFGSALQAFALKRVLEKLNHEPQIINFEFEKDLAQYKLFRTHLYKERKQAFIADLYYYNRNLKRKRNFEKFRANYLPLTSKIYRFGKDSLQDLNSSFDAFICGSDQIWNLNCTEEFVPEYFLSFADDDKLKISYAPSMPAPVEKKYYNQIKKCINRLDTVSVREKWTIDYLHNEVNVNKEISHVVDPTLLLSSEDYLNSFNIQKENCDPYIFVYILGGRDQHSLVMSEINRIQEKTKCKIKYVCNRKLTGLNNTEYCLGIGPKEFLSLLYNASYVVTDSFHATVFSILFSKRLCVFARKGSSSRMKELLHTCNMDSCFFENGNISWLNENVENRNLEKLQELILPSLEFIKNSLK